MLPPMKAGETRTARCWETCVACGARYHRKWHQPGDDPMQVIGASDHVCDPKRLAARERELRHEFDDESAYCECDDLDCKFEYLESLMNEME
jgi:hypothetical protein